MKQSCQFQTLPQGFRALPGTAKVRASTVFLWPYAVSRRGGDRRRASFGFTAFPWSTHATFPYFTGTGTGTEQNIYTMGHGAEPWTLYTLTACSIG